MTRTILVLALLAGLAPAAWAEDDQAQTPPPGPPSQGPMTIERVYNGFAGAPEFKIANVDGKAGPLLGGYGGVLLDNTLLLGGGAYWLLDETASVHSMGYGGFVIEWLQRLNRPVGFSVRGLVGGGVATTIDTIPVYSYNYPTPYGGRGPFVPGTPSTNLVTVHTHTDYFVAEPQANVLFNLSPRLRISLGAGYRFIAGAYGDDGRLSGPTGSIALQFGGTPRPTRP
jgi:hypothetical protein